MKKVRGEKNGLCNVTACRAANWVEYYNHSTRKFYCKSCAMKLNRIHRADAMELWGHDLCTKVEENVKSWKDFIKFVAGKPCKVEDYIDTGETRDGVNDITWGLKIICDDREFLIGLDHEDADLTMLSL